MSLTETFERRPSRAIVSSSSKYTSRVCSASATIGDVLAEIVERSRHPLRVEPADGSHCVGDRAARDEALREEEEAPGKQRVGCEQPVDRRHEPTRSTVRTIPASPAR